MAEYNYPNDGKLHTRFSELTRCTPGQIERVVAERMGDDNRYTNEIMEFGTVRHEKLAEYIKKNSQLPPRFNLDLKCEPENAERQIAIEMFPNVVIHATPDVFDTDWIADFKTTTGDGKNYGSSKQVTFYAWLLSFYGYDIKTVYYLCERWDKERTKIIEYPEPIKKEVDKEIFNDLREWTLGRVHLLQTTLRYYQKVEV